MELREKLYPVFQHWLAIGLFVQLAGLCLIVDGSRYATQVNLLLFLPSILVAVLYGRGIELWRQAAGKVFLLLLLWVLVIAFFHPGSEGTVWRWLKVAAMVLFFVLAVFQLMRKEHLLERVLLAFVLVAGVCAWGSLYQNFYVDGRPMGYRLSRISAWGWHGLADFRNPIVSALYYGAGLIVALHMSLRPAKIQFIRSLEISALIGLAAVLFFTYSRGVWFAALAAIAVLLCLSLTWKALSRLLLWGASVLVLIGIIGHRFFVQFGVGLNYRDEIWAHWFKEMGDSWLLGNGAGAPFNACVPAIGTCFNQAHSLYLQFVHEFGIVGLALLLGCTVLLLARGWEHRQQGQGRLGISLIIYGSVAGIANFHEIFIRPGVYWVVFWLPVAILLGLSKPHSSADQVIPERG